MRRISRRTFVALSAGVGAIAAGAIVLRGFGSDGCASAEGVDAVRCRLAAFLSDPSGVAALGDAASDSLRASAGAFAAAIAPASESEPERWFATVGNDAFGSHLRDRARADRAAAEIVVVDGWPLSRTEAQLCVLWSLVR